jgi:hypothetical protein
MRWEWLKILEMSNQDTLYQKKIEDSTKVIRSRNSIMNRQHNDKKANERKG